MIISWSKVIPNYLLSYKLISKEKLGDEDVVWNKQMLVFYL